jgi:acetylcholinesterase/cholinesterase
MSCFLPGTGSFLFLFLFLFLVHQSFTKVVAKDAGCGGSSPYEACMRNLTWEELLAGATKAQTDVIAELGTFLNLFQPYGPTAGTPELPHQLMEGFLTGQTLDLPLVLGSVRQEGMIFIYEAFGKPVARAEEDALLIAIFGLKNIEKVLKQYPRNPAHYKDLRNHTVRCHLLAVSFFFLLPSSFFLLPSSFSPIFSFFLPPLFFQAVIVTDALFQCPIRNIANNLGGKAKNGTRKSGSPYVYHFDHVLSFGDKFWLPSSPICLNTVCHGDELPILFHPNISKIDATYTKSEQILSKEMQDYWSNFAKTSMPAASDGLKWPTFSSGEGENAMKFSTTNESVVVQEYESKCKMWDELGYKWILPH